MHHTIPPDKVFNYPILQSSEYEEIVFISKGSIQVKVFVGMQDDFWVNGWSYSIVCENKNTLSAFSPASRKYGEYETRSNAIEEAVEKITRGLGRYILGNSEHSSIVSVVIRELQEKYKTINGKQIELFK